MVLTLFAFSILVFQEISVMNNKIHYDNILFLNSNTEFT